MILREALDQIDAILASDDNELSGALWDVLTALRGPDNGSEDLKFRTTVYIRSAAFPKTTAAVNNLASRKAFFGGSASYQPLSKEECIKNWHFANHTRLAAKHLGLSTEEAPNEKD